MSSCSALSLPSGMAALHDRASLLAGAFLPLLHVAKTHKALVRFSIKGSSNRKGFMQYGYITHTHEGECSGSLYIKSSLAESFHAHVQTEVCQGQHTLIWEQLRTFPSEELTGKVVLVRCNLDVSFEKEHIIDEEPIVSAAPTIAYLQQLGARTVLASHWQPIKSPVENLDAQLIAGWTPICFGQQSLETTNAALQVCKMALWIGPVSMGGPLAPPEMAMLFATIFGKISQRGCITIVGGKEACSAVKNVGVASLITHLSGGGSAFLNLLKGMTLPGVAALDLACPMVLDWGEIYGNPYLPLFIDIGSGNGVFNLQMAQKYQDPQNYLGLEINRKLVKRCLDSVVTLQLRNVHFVTADATTALQRIVHNYPGQVTSVAVQCPDPNFSDPDSRWRVVQRRLVEAVVDILCKDGKVFLQSDVKDVAIQMKSEFLKYSGKNLVLSIEHLDPQKCDTEGWLNDNPFDISTDWENHVLERGDQMYRILLSRLGS
eukprot:c25759_g1_i4 orf=321-1787(-)